MKSEFHKIDDEYALVYSIKNGKEVFLFIVNSSQEEFEFITPNKNYDVLVNANISGNVPIFKISDKIDVKPKTGYILYKSY